MVTRLPRVMVAAPASGHGKTTIATGLMAALRARGEVVSPHKVGPDYIDPGFHALACGRPGRNLDPWLCREERIVPLLLHGAAVSEPASVAVVEGVMGLFDGRLGTRGYASSAHIARLTRTPVVLVVDTSHTSRSIGALVHGMATFDADVRVGGVILNKVASAKHEAEIREAVTEAGVRVLGCVGRDADIEHPSRHLGLVPAEESAEATELVASLADRVATAVDLDAVLELAATAPDLENPAWDPATEVAPASTVRPVVAVFGGRAFTFRYRETAELLEAAGCDVVEVDPLTDSALPDGVSGLYLGGGFPEVHATELAANTGFAASVREAVATGVPTVAECAGLLYLGQDVDGVPMSGALTHTAAMHPRLAMGYRRAVAPTDTLLARAGETATGHEFHRTRVSGVEGGAAWTWDDTADGISCDPSGSGHPTVHASYLHLHWGGNPRLAQRFADAVHAHAGRRDLTALPLRPGAPSGSTWRTVGHDVAHVDLSHHGDRDVVTDGVDFAVNVHPDGPPTWLRDALASVDLTSYPDARPAATAIAAHLGLDPSTVLPTAGAAEAFTLLARAWSKRRWCVVHPQFTEPEHALRVAGASVHRHVLRPPFQLDVAALLDDCRAHGCDVVMVGNPTNPTGVLHARADLERIVAAGLTLVVDEAFLDDADGHSMIFSPPGRDVAPDGLPGRAQGAVESHSTGCQVVVRSLTKLWGIAGVRAGWVTSDANTLATLARLQSPWSVSSHAIAAMRAIHTPAGDTEAARRTAAVPAARSDLVAHLTALGLDVVPGWNQCPFVLVDTHLPASPRERLAALGVGVRRGETFPGLGPSWIRLAVRSPQHHTTLCDALGHLLASEGLR